MIRSGRRLFPVGLYSTLLAAACCLAVPAIPRQVESWLRSLQCLPLRSWNVVLATEGAPSGEGADVQAVREFGHRLGSVARDTGDVHMPADMAGILCRVIAREGRGGGGLPASLLLDRRVRDLVGCQSFVTYGDRLVGFLDLDGRPEDLARVRLLNDRERRRRMTARVRLNDTWQNFVVEPAATRDEFPLRVQTMEDPYSLSQIENSGQVVETVDLGKDPVGAIPAGLRVGRLRVFGYATGSRVVPVQLYVTPEQDPRAISAVIVWRPRQGHPIAPVAVGHARSKVHLLHLPAPKPMRERWFVSSTSGLAIPEGAALVHGRRLVGTVVTTGTGSALAARFGSVGRVWSVTLLPDDPNRAPSDLLVRVRSRDVQGVHLTILAGRLEGESGRLFSGANGRHCPGGLLLGQVSSEPEDLGGLLLRVDSIPAAGLSVLSERRESTP